MSDDSQHKPPLAPEKAPRVSGLSALHGELAEPMIEFPSEPPPPVAPPPMVDFGSEPPPPDDEHAIMRGEDFGRWAEPEAPKRSIDTMVGKVVDGRYEIKGMIGRGGMGAVFEAWQPSVQRTVALKVLLREFAENETVIKRFHKEALAASRLQHPNTISVYDFGQTDDGVLFIAMEYLRGVDLSRVLDEGPMPVDRALAIMRQVCKSLSEAHKAGVIHRDLKPDNVFLTDVEGEDDFVKVLDFGVAKLKEGDGHERTLTQAGTMFGTPKYMSPEQTRSTQIDARSDIYSLGVILYEMLLGEPPFVSDNPLSILIAHVNEQPAPFAHRQPDLDLHPAVEAVVFQALSKDREERQASVDALLDQIEALAELRAGAPFATLADRLPDPAAFGLGVPAEAPPLRITDVADVVLDGPPPREERKAPVVPIVLAAVAVTAVLFVVFGMRGDPPTPPPDNGAEKAGMTTQVEPPEPPPPEPIVDAAAPEPVSFEFSIKTTPGDLVFERVEGDMARPIELAGRALDGSAVRIRLDSKTTLRISKKGYEPQTLELDPEAPGEGQIEVTLEKKEVEKAAPRTERPIARRKPQPRDPPPREQPAPNVGAGIPAEPPPPPPPQPEPEAEPVPIELMP